MALMSFRNDPFGGLVGLQGALDRLLQDRNPPWGFGPSGRGVFPPINVFADQGGALIVRAEVPGIDLEKIDVQVEPQRLTLSGERAGAAGATDEGFHRRERRFGRFSRSVQLPPDLDPQTATASYEDGILSVRIEKAAAAQPRRVSVTG